MSSSPPPSKIPLTPRQFLSDLTQVFRRHKVPFGHPADIEHLGSYLDSNPAFRGDLFTLCTAISHMSETDLPPENLLDLTAHAITGGRDTAAPIEIPGTVAAAFLTAYSTWVSRDSMEMLGLSDDEIEDSPSWQPPSAPFSTAASLSGTHGHRSKRGPESSASPSPSPDTPLGSLTLGELKNYLDDIEHRVRRLQPYLDALNQAPSEVKSAPTEPSTAPAINPLPPIPASTPVEAPPSAPSRRTAPVSQAQAALADAGRPGFGPAQDLRSLIPAHAGDRRHTNSRLLLPAAALAVIAIGAAFAYHSYNRPAASPAPVSVGPDRSLSAHPEPQPVAAPVGVRTAFTPPSLQRPTPDDLHSHSAPSAPLPAPRPSPIAAVSSTAGIGAAIKPLLTTAATTPPVPTTGPAMPRPVPTLPDVHQTSLVVPASTGTRSPQPQPPLPQPIESSGQHSVSPQPTPAAPAGSIATAASTTRPSIPPVQAAPVVRVAPEPELAVSVPSPTMMGYALSTPSPVLSNSRRILMDASVLVQARIAKDGHVASATALSGTTDLGSAAVAATEKWRFRPYKVNGTPVEVVTTIRFVFKAQR